MQSHTRLAVLSPLLALTPAAAQRVKIAHAEPAAIVQRIAAHVTPQGFKLEHADAKGALFTLDRGMVPQPGNALIPFVHVVLELHFRFRAQDDSLTVDASEEAVGQRGQPAEFRRPVDSARDRLQQFLDQIRAESDSAAAHADTTHAPGDSARSAAPPPAPAPPSEGAIRRNS